MGELAEKVVWVPAHISEARIREVLCGNGTPITRDMWLGNKLVDELAKLGAQAIKAPQDVVRRVAARQRQAQELAVFVGQVNNAWPGIDGKPQRDSTGMLQGARRSKKRRRRASIEAGKDEGGDDGDAPGTVVLPKENVTAWPRSSPTLSLAAARARRLRKAAARAEAQNEASFSEWRRHSRDLRMSQTLVDRSRRLSASEWLDALRRRRGIPVQDA